MSPVRAVRLRPHMAAHRYQGTESWGFAHGLHMRWPRTVLAGRTPHPASYFGQEGHTREPDFFVVLRPPRPYRTDHANPKRL